MYPVLLTIGPLVIHSYGLMLGLGVVAALYLAWHRAEKRGLPQSSVTILAVVCLLAGVVGAKLFYAAAHWQEVLQAPWKALGGEGFVVYGGILLGLAAGWLCCQRKGMAFPQWLDLFAPPVALAQGFGRLGCFLAGCCYGAPASGLGVTFPAGSSAPAGIPLVPVQLYSAAGDFLLAGLLLFYDRRRHIDGMTGVLYLALYSLGRFVIEFWRADPRGFVGPLATSQFIALFAAAGAALLFFHLRKRKEPDHGKQAPDR